MNAAQRHFPWQDPSFLDVQNLDEELRRVFDICHGCRLCFNLCDSFPRLFDLIDAAPTEELDSVASSDFDLVEKACTLCDMCYTTTCPYTPPHEFSVDFPVLMLRFRYANRQKGDASFVQDQLAQTDRNGALLSHIPALSNTILKNSTTRHALEKITGIDRNAALPNVSKNTLIKEFSTFVQDINTKAPAFGQKVVLFATCYGNFNAPHISLKAIQVLNKNGIEVELTYPGCCGMPLFEGAQLLDLQKQLEDIIPTLHAPILDNKKILTTVPSCTFMLQSNAPMLLPEDARIQDVAKNTFDISAYLIWVSKNFGLLPFTHTVPDVTLHMACHSRAQNVGAKAAELLRLIPDLKVKLVERCSGHGGTWGLMKDNREAVLKTGKVAIKRLSEARDQENLCASECPLAAAHFGQETQQKIPHPIEIFAMGYGI